MDSNKQIQAFAGELHSLVVRYQMEFDIPYASIVGVLNMQVHLLNEEAIDAAYFQDEREED